MENDLFVHSLWPPPPITKIGLSVDKRNQDISTLVLSSDWM
jgi:hypothetical protein